jgi:PTS system cellobiose-specific IIB component
MAYNIILICKWGASTGILVEKMREAAEKKGVDCAINAVGEAEADKILPDVDIVLLAPQARFHLKDYQEKVKEYGTPVLVISTVDYGMLEGANVLESALKELEKEGGA